MLTEYAFYNVTEVIRKVNEEWGPTHSDHNEDFRRIGISAMCSLLARGPECCMQKAFYCGYSCKGVAFRQVIEHEIEESCGATGPEVSLVVGARERCFSQINFIPSCIYE